MHQQKLIDSLESWIVTRLEGKGYETDTEHLPKMISEYRGLLLDELAARKLTANTSKISAVAGSKPPFTFTATDESDIKQLENQILKILRDSKLNMKKVNESLDNSRIQYNVNYPVDDGHLR